MVVLKAINYLKSPSPNTKSVYRSVSVFTLHTRTQEFWESFWKGNYFSPSPFFFLLIKVIYKWLYKMRRNTRGGTYAKGMNEQ